MVSLKVLFGMFFLCSPLSMWTIELPRSNHILIIREETCATCQKMSPIIDEAQKLFKDFVNFEIINSTQAREKGFNVENFPTIMFYQHDNLEHTSSGFDPYLLTTISEVFNLFINPVTDKIIAQSLIFPLDVVIIGSGPAGIAATTYAARNEMNYLTITGEYPGGTIMSVHELNNWPGNVGIAGNYLGQKLLSDAAEYDALFVYDHVVDVNYEHEIYTLTTALRKTIKARALLIATGTTHIVPEISGIEAYLGKNVAVCSVCDAGSYKNKSVVIYGNTDKAVEHIDDLAELVKNIMLIIPEKIINQKIINAAKHYNNILIYIDWKIFDIEGDGDLLTGITLCHNVTGEYITIDIDGVFLALGQRPQADIITELVACDDHGFILINKNYQCYEAHDFSKQAVGIFAAGDVVNPMLKQAIIASAQGLSAIIAIKEWLHTL